MNIIGRLTKDAEVRTTPSTKQVVNFSVAINDNYRNKQGERINNATYFDCSYWVTPNVAGLLKKGTIVELAGKVSTRAWIGKDGEAHAALNFHTSQIKIHGNGKNSDGRPSSLNNASTNQVDTVQNPGPEDDLPF